MASVALCAAAAMAGCGGAPPPTVESTTGDAAGRLLSGREADSLSAGASRQAAGLSSLRGSAALLLKETPGAHPRRLEVQLAARRGGPARLRGRYGVLATLFDLALAGDSLAIYFPRDATLVAGPLASWREAPFPGAAQLVELLLPRLPDAATAVPPVWLATPAGLVLTLRSVEAPGETLLCRQTFEPKRFRMVRQVFETRGPGTAPPLVVEYDRHRWTGATWFPEVVRAHVVGEPESCELRFSTSSLNGEIPPEVFRLELPAGVRRVLPEQLSRRLIDETGEE